MTSADGEGVAAGRGAGVCVYADSTAPGEVKGRLGCSLLWPGEHAMTIAVVSRARQAARCANTIADPDGAVEPR